MLGPILDPALLMLIIGGVSAAILAVAAKVFYVEVDAKVVAVEEVLPGANCGGCGYTGCSACAEAIVAGTAPVSACVAGGPDVWAKVAAVMGGEIAFAEAKLADNYCTGGFRADRAYRYDGAMDCRTAFQLYGGDLKCSHGCLGFGACVKACQFGALSMGPEGVPVVDERRCVGCGACERACPVGVMKLRTMSRRLLEFNDVRQCVEPCRQLCPAQINIKEYIRLGAEGKYREALEVIRERNPLPLTCGRICPAPCEQYCRRSFLDGQEAVHHNYIKRFVSDWEMNQADRPLPPMLPDSGRKVAIIGGGPAGLSAAYYLRRLGHKPVIIEALPQLGGMLRYGIPEYRLPKAKLDFEINEILRLGVDVKLNARVGKDVAFKDLLADYDAVFLAAGAWDNHKLRIDGEDLDGVFKGTEFLAKRELGEKVNLSGKRVMVVGGGNTAIDAARTSLRLGAQEVTMLYRRTRAEMPANAVEIEAAEHEGIKFLFLAAPTKLVGDKGKLTQIEYLTMQLGEPDKSGRRSPVPIEGSEKLCDVDVVIAAIGQLPKNDWFGDELKEAGLKITKWNTVEAHDATLQTGLAKVFTAGDIFSGPALVVDAIGTGRRAARSIHQLLTGQEVAVPEGVLYKPFKVPESSLAAHPVQQVAPKPRVPQPEIEVRERIHSFDEVDLTLTTEQMKQEADRCLYCGTLCYDSDPEKQQRALLGKESALEKLARALRESP